MSMTSERPTDIRSSCSTGSPEQVRREWVAQIDHLAATYRLIVPDLRGHGRTDNPLGRPGMNHRQFAADMAAMCDQLGVNRAVFIGESTGSMLQLSLALARPDLVAASVLSASTFFWSPALRASLSRPDPEDLARTWFSNSESFDDFCATHTALGPDHWRTVVGDFIALFTHDHRALFTHDHREDFPDKSDLARIEAPVLVVHGDRDHLFDPEIAYRLYRKLPHAELCVLPNTGHWPPSEQPAVFNLHAAEFLQRITTS